MFEWNEKNDSCKNSKHALKYLMKSNSSRFMKHIATQRTSELHEILFNSGKLLYTQMIGMKSLSVIKFVALPTMNFKPSTRLLWEFKVFAKCDYKIEERARLEQL